MGRKKRGNKSEALLVKELPAPLTASAKSTGVPMLQFFVGWVFIGILVPVLIGIGIGVLSMSPPAFLIAKVCFTVAAIALLVKTGWWVAFEAGPRAERLVGIFFIFGITATLWAASIGWVSARQAMAGRNRTLSDWQKVKLVSNLSRYGQQKVVIIASAGDDTQGYARDFRDVLIATGWRVAGPIPASKTMPVVDVQISVSQKYFGQGAPEPYVTLRGTLEFVVLHVERI